MIRFFIFSILSVLGMSAYASGISYDAAGFAECLTVKEKTYFLFRDKNSQAVFQNYTFISSEDYQRITHHAVRGCRDVPYLKDFPAENLKRVTDYKNLFPSIVIQGADQLAIGGRVFRAEANAIEFFKNRRNLFVVDQPEKLTDLINAYGKKFTGELVQIWLKALEHQQGSDCSQLIGTCDFYLCQERKNPCGVEGYNLSYGYKYCSASRFDLLSMMSSASGKSWVRSVISCLQVDNFKFSESLQSGSDQRCEDIRQRALDVHPECYVEGGFCQLGLSEKMNIFSVIKSEILSKDTAAQGIQTLKLCGASKVSDPQEGM